MKPTRPPVIVIGMHRSGTTLVTQALRRLGLFTGWRHEGNGEARWFLGVNEWLLHQSGGAWDRPLPIDDLFAHPTAHGLAAAYVRRTLRGPRVVSFLGPRRMLRCGSPFGLDEPWGWKDPRNTFTLPLWLDVFPGARVICVERHGLDVARSLVARERTSLTQRKASFERRGWVYGWWPKRHGFTHSLRSATIEGGLALWLEYVRRGRREVERLGPRAMTVRYEALLASPVSQLTAVADFAGLDPSGARLDEVAAAINPQRRLAFAEDPEGAAQCEAFADLLAEGGYPPTTGRAADENEPGRGVAARGLALTEAR